MRLVPVMLCLCCGLWGCSEMVSTDPERNKPLRPKTTYDIGEFKGDSEVVQPDVEVSNPLTAPLEAYEPMKQKLAALNIDQAVNLFHATEGRYPKDHDEFMQRVIKANRIRLPEPAHGLRYEYDVDAHKLVVVQTGEQEQP